MQLYPSTFSSLYFKVHPTMRKTNWPHLQNIFKIRLYSHSLQSGLLASPWTDSRQSQVRLLFSTPSVSSFFTERSQNPYPVLPGPTLQGLPSSQSSSFVPLFLLIASPSLPWFLPHQSLCTPCCLWLEQFSPSSSKYLLFYWTSYRALLNTLFKRPSLGTLYKIGNFPLKASDILYTFVAVQMLSPVWLLETPWTAACQVPCPSPAPGACSNSCPLSQWCHLTISSSVTPFSPCLQSFPASESFPMTQFFASGGQNTGASASVLPMNIQGWFPLQLTVWSLCCQRESQESSPTPQFKSINSSVLSLLYGPTLTSIHDY